MDRRDVPDRGGLISTLESAQLQFLAVMAATILIGAWHWQNDGLWFQGDAPRHAATGLFFWDLLTTLPAHPLSYALSYYARYPVISAGAYPPLFHVIEGVAFGLVGPSPYAAKALVLACGSVTGIYAMLWGRRWIAPGAGWAGACTVLLPGFVCYSNAVLLNVPATALGLAALYHFHAWLDGARSRDRALFVWFTLGATLTYYPGGIVLPIAMTWMVCSRDRVRGRFLWVLLALLGLIVVVLAIALPAHFARQVPTLAKLTSPINWIFYSHHLIALVGLAWCVLAGFGVVAGLAMRALRAETTRLVLAFSSAVICLAFLPARDERYALLLGPFVVLSAFVAITTVAAAAGRWRGFVTMAAVGAILALATRSVIRTPLEIVTGIDQVALYLRANGPSDAVLYSGNFDGVFGFYARAFDPAFERRVLFSGRLLYQYKQTMEFFWVETPYVASEGDVTALIQSKSGCRWVAVEVGQERALGTSEHLLRRAVQGAEFELVRSFPVKAGRVTHIDLYRFTQPLAPAPPMDLMFPSFSARVFQGVEPIESRP